jgi:hypothetical protein
VPKNKTKKKPLHVSYNKKSFLAPDSILSMAAIHTKIKPDGEASIRISDCNRSIKIWNDLNDKKQCREMITKIESLITGLTEFKKEVEIKIQ